MKRWSSNTVICFLGFSFLLVFSHSSHGQEIEKLKSKKQSLIKEIASTNKILQSTESKKKNTLSELLSISKKINSRKDLLHTISEELTIYRDSMNNIQQEIDILEGYLKGVETEYAKMSQQLLIHEKISGDLPFVLSSKNLDELKLRIIFLNQYQSIRKRQLKNLVETIHELHLRHTQFQFLLHKKESLIEEKKNQAELLEEERESRNNLLENLKSKEKEIRKKLEAQNEIVAQIDRDIQKLIEKSMAENSSNEALELSAVFEENKGLYPPPLTNSIVIRSFGVQNHPSIAGLKIKNNGIDLMTEKKVQIRPIFDGEIRGVMSVPGYGQVVLISHGSYFSLYGNLLAKELSKGDRVNVSTIIGETIVHPEFNQHVLHFELWKGKQKLNPENWINFN